MIAAAGAIALSDFQINERAKDTTSVLNESVATSGLGVKSRGSLFIGASACRNVSGTSIPIAGIYCNVSSDGVITFDADNFSIGGAFIDYSFYTSTHIMNITNNGLIGIDNTTSYFGTAGTIAGVALLLTIVIGAFYFVTRKQEEA